MPTAVVITGIKDIDRRLKTLLPRLQKKVLRQAMRAGLKVLAAEVKEQAPVDTGMMQSKVKVRAVKKAKRDEIELEVRIAADEHTKTTSKTGKTTFYPAVIQYGREGVPPDPFMTRAFNARGEDARQVTIQTIRSGTEREIAAKG
jgi:HK97 gp10 family phage protein